MRRLLALLALAALVAGCGKNAKRDNVEEPAELLEFTPSVSVSKVWSQDLGKGERRLGIRQHPTIDGTQAYAADPKGKLYAFDAISGATAWSVDTKLRISSSPGVGEGTLVIGTLDGDVVAFNPDTGSERWRNRVTAEVVAAPVVAKLTGWTGNCGNDTDASSLSVVSEAVAVDVAPGAVGIGFAVSRRTSQGSASTSPLTPSQPVAPGPPLHPHQLWRASIADPSSLSTPRALPAIRLAVTTTVSSTLSPSAGSRTVWIAAPGVWAPTPVIELPMMLIPPLGLGL